MSVVDKRNESPARVMHMMILIRKMEGRLKRDLRRKDLADYTIRSIDKQLYVVSWAFDILCEKLGVEKEEVDKRIREFDRTGRSFQHEKADTIVEKPKRQVVEESKVANEAEITEELAKVWLQQ